MAPTATAQIPATRPVRRPRKGARTSKSTRRTSPHCLMRARTSFAHSYGVLGTLLAATRGPARVRSLTLIEPPLYYLVPSDPEVARLERMGNAVLTQGLEADAATLREFLRLAGAPEVDDGPLPDDVARGVRRAHGGRVPGEARPALGLVRDAGIPSLVASGGHAPGLERICDALSTVLDAQRLVAPGAGHFVAAAPGFVNRLHEFLVSAA